MSRALLVKILLALTTLCAISAANSAGITYASTPLGGNAWRFDYVIDNSVPTIAFDEVTIFFDQTLYGALGPGSTVSGWDLLVVQPDTAIPASGLYDVVRLAGPLTAPDIIAGFSVSFQYLATGVPGSQAFDLIDSSSFAVVLSGRTTIAQAPTLIPEPCTGLLMLLGLLLAATWQHQASRPKPATIAR